MNELPVDFSGQPERRTKIRESNEKLDIAINHLSDVLDHIKVTDDKRMIQDQLNSLRTYYLYSFVLVWIFFLAVVTYLFVNVRDQTSLTTSVTVLTLKHEDAMKDLNRLKSLSEKMHPKEVNK